MQWALLPEQQELLPEQLTDGWEEFSATFSTPLPFFFLLLFHWRIFAGHVTYDQVQLATICRAIVKV